MMRLFSENPNNNNNGFEGERNKTVAVTATPINTCASASSTTTTTTGGVAIKESKRKVVYIAGSWDMFHAGHLQVPGYSYLFWMSINLYPLLPLSLHLLP